MAKNLTTEFQKAKNALMGAQKICIISHRRPDGDAVGSNVALKMALENVGKEVVSACVDPVPEDSVFLKGAADFVTDFDYEDFDAIVSVDCGGLKLVSFHEKKPKILSGKIPFINIDHHESNEHFGTINVVDPEACATAFILYFFFEQCGWEITIDIATALLHGVYFDTGSLMHSNTSAEVYEVCGKLVARGADLRRVVKELFYTRSVSKLKLLGRILEKTYINEEGVTVSAVGTEDYLACGADSQDTGGAIDYLNMVPGSKYSVLLSEDRERGIVKGSLRTRRDDVNLSEIASQWGGGGHPKASGFGVEGHLKPVMSWKVVPEDGSDKGTEIEF